MPKGNIRTWPLIRIIILANLAAICGLYYYVVQHFSSQPSSQPTTQQAMQMRLAARLMDTSENELQERADKLEASVRSNLEHDRILLTQAPPKDWEAIAREGALKLQDAWNKSEDKSWWKQPGFHLSYSEPDPQYPFQRIKTSEGKDTGAIMLAAPFYDSNYYRGEQARALFWRLKAKGHIMVAIMSYQEFPGRIMNPFDDRQVNEKDKAVHQAVDAWLHCSRFPDQLLPPGSARLLLSESDFPDPMRNDGGGVLIPDNTIEKKFDLVFSNQGGEWNDFARNWTLAKACVKALVQELDLKVLILGRNVSQDTDADIYPLLEKGNVEIRPPGTPWRDFLRLMQLSRAIFVPNIHDASPRVVTEAMILGIPAVMNYHIVGGWKYINEQTGEFFHDSRDVVDAFRRLRDPQRAAKLRPREWFSENWGKDWSSYLLQAFLTEVAGEERLAAIQRDLAAFDLRNQEETERERQNALRYEAEGSKW